MTTDEAKRILSKLGFKYGVSPRLIATRLLSEEDKKDMVAGLVSMEDLETAIQVWMESGMPNYAEGDYKPFEETLDLYTPKQGWR